VSPRLRHLSGRQVVSILERFGFRAISQRGSHIKLQRITDIGAKQTLTMPAHDELDTGTLRAIVRQASNYIAEDDLRPHFYTD